VAADAAGLPLAADPAWLGAATLGAALLGDGVAPLEQALAPMTASKPSATIRLLTGVFTGDSLLQGTVLGPGLSVAPVWTPNVAGLGLSDSMPSQPSRSAINGHFALG
jgi:hypothetical protein